MKRSYQWLSLLILLAISGQCLCWSFLSSSSDIARDEEKALEHHLGGRRPWSGGDVVEFSMEGLKDDKQALELVTKAESKMIGSADSCWSNAYRSLFKGCSEIGSSKELQYRLAWHLTNCYQEDAGTPLPTCDAKTPIMKCRQKLNADESARFAAYFLDINNMCHQLQVTERLVNALQKTTKYAEDKLEKIEERSEYLLQNSKDILDSLSSVDVRMKHLEETSKNVENYIDVVLKHSELVYEQSKGIAAAQVDLQERQAKMKEKLEEGMETVHEAYVNLGRGIENLREEAEVGQKKQGELLQRQQQLHQAHDNLIENSQHIFQAQKVFESKQASMLVALDKLFALHNALLLESRSIKAFFIFSLSIFIICMFTSAKQTFAVRLWLFIGLCVTFSVEFSILRFTSYSIEQQTWSINMVISVYAVLALVLLFYAVYAYRNSSWRTDDMDEDDDIIWSRWIDADIPEDVGPLEDPDYLIEESDRENSITAFSNVRRYNLRPRINRENSITTFSNARRYNLRPRR